MLYRNEVITSSSLNSGHRFIGCLINVSTVFQNCVFERCVFSHSSTRFSNCEFKNNIYPNECDWEELKLDIYQNRLPEGDLIGYKKVYTENYSDYMIAKLLIPAKARRVCSASNKVRSSYAKVLGFYNLNGKKSRTKNGYSLHYHDFKYSVGEIVRSTKKFDTSAKTCSTGIHFFLTFKEAVEY